MSKETLQEKLAALGHSQKAIDKIVCTIYEHLTSGGVISFGCVDLYLHTENMYGSNVHALDVKEQQK